MDTSANDVVIGIDLGTTFSCVAWWDWSLNRPDVITNEHGNRTTPSIVCYASDDIYVGETARSKMPMNSDNAIYNAKRIIGRRYSQIRPEDLESWPYTVIHRGDDKPRYRVNFRGQECFIAPEEVSARVLGKLKQSVERQLKRSIRKAVVTVPAYFTEPQKRATKDAGALAGLDVIGMMTEPTAAALAYGIDQKALNEDRKAKAEIDGWWILVFDLGGGTLDVSVLRLDGRGAFVTKAITGDFHLGGEDFDNVIMNYVITLFNEEYPSIILNKRSMQRLRAECEKAKRTLSDCPEAVIDMELQGCDVAYVVAREKFEELSAELFESVMAEVDDALELAHCEPRDIDDIVLVGGSTRIPRVQEMLRKRFAEKNLWTGINPDEAVACGAAIQGAALLLNQQQLQQQQQQQQAVAAPQQQARESGGVTEADFMEVGSSDEEEDAKNNAAPFAQAQQHQQPAFPNNQHHHHHHQQQQFAGRGRGVGRGGAQPHHHHHQHQHQHQHHQHHQHQQQFRGGMPRGGAAAGRGGISNTPQRQVVPHKKLSGATEANSVGGLDIDKLVLTEVTPHTLGIELSDHTLDVLIKRGTQIPARKVDHYTTSLENQRSVTISIYEGENIKDATANNKIGQFQLEIPKAEVGVPRIEVVFEVMLSDRQSLHR